jgi:glycosyltransferase involved in cell wall biosynthesis
MYKQQKIIVVLPAYNAASTLEMTVHDIPDMVDEIILVDDKSDDATVAVAKRLGLFVFRRVSNGGYGANQKTCYRLALDHGADIIVMVHPDYQYDPKLINFFAEFIGSNFFDVMLGTRIRSRREALAGGMPIYKYISNRALTILENFVSGYNLSEWHTGMRAYKREVLASIDWQSNSDDFVFDTEMLFKIVAKNYRIGETPVPVRYFKNASSINFRRSLKYGLATVWVCLKYMFGLFK